MVELAAAVSWRSREVMEEEGDSGDGAGEDAGDFAAEFNALPTVVADDEFDVVVLAGFDEDAGGLVIFGEEGRLVRVAPTWKEPERSAATARALAWVLVALTMSPAVVVRLSWLLRRAILVVSVVEPGRTGEAGVGDAGGAAVEIEGDVGGGLGGYVGLKLEGVEGYGDGFGCAEVTGEDAGFSRGGEDGGVDEGADDDPGGVVRGVGAISAVTEMPTVLARWTGGAAR